MIINTKRSYFGLFLDFVLTAIGWVAFFMLAGRGILSIVEGRTAGIDVPFWPSFIPTVETLLAYLLVGICNAAVLFIWALYNKRRFGGMDRRQALPALSDDELTDSFSVTPTQLEQLRGARIAIIHHAGDGEISEIECGESLQPIMSKPTLSVVTPLHAGRAR